MQGKTNSKKPAEDPTTALLLLNERNEARANYVAVAAIVRKQDQELHYYRKQVTRLVDESKGEGTSSQRKQIAILESENANIRDQLHDMFRKRNEHRDKAHVAETQLDNSRDRERELHFNLETVSIWFGITTIVAVVSLITNAVLWFKM